MIKVNKLWALALTMLMLIVLLGVFDPLFNRVVKAANWTDDGFYAENFAGGDGTDANPYLISNAKEFARMGVITGSHMGKLSFKLISTINLNGYNWKIVNNTNMYHENLTASIDFNGNAHTIENLNSVNGENGGIFKYFNGKFYNTFIKSSYVNNAASGTITSHLVGIIENVQITGKVVSKNNQAGGIAAFNSGSSTISNCSFIGDVEFNPDSVALQNKNEIKRTIVYNFTRGENYGSEINGVLIHAYQKVFYEDTKLTTRSLSENFWVGGIAGIGAGTIKDCYFVGDIIGSKTINSKSYVYNIDDRNGLPYTEEFVNKNTLSGTGKPVNDISQSRWGRHWVRFKTINKFTAAEVSQAANDYFGFLVNENSSHQATIYNSPWLAEAEYNRLTNGTFEGHKQSYTVTTTGEEFSTYYPYAISGEGNIINCFFQSGNNNLNLVGQSNKSNDMSKQHISSNWAIDSSINGGYPYLKTLYWQDAV